jgi:hypothetical protein
MQDIRYKINETAVARCGAGRSITTPAKIRLEVHVLKGRHGGRGNGRVDDARRFMRVRRRRARRAAHRINRDMTTALVAPQPHDPAASQASQMPSPSMFRAAKR